MKRRRYVKPEMNVITVLSEGSVMKEASWNPGDGTMPIDDGDPGDDGDEDNYGTNDGNNAKASWDIW